MFPSMPTPPTSTGGLAPEQVGGSDSLTQFLRALNNYLQAQGQGTFNYGQQLTGQAAQGVGTAGQTLQPSVDYYQALLSGDPTRMAAAAAPTANAISSQYDQAARSLATTAPRGGFSAGLQAAAPFQKAGAVGTALEQIQPAAAQGLQSAAGLQGNLAAILSQLGLGTSGLGSSLLNLASSNQLARRGQNTQQDISNLSNLTSGLKSLVPSTSFSGTISDRRAKRDLLRIGEVLGSVPVYLFRYIGSPSWHVGVVAQELLPVLPSAVGVRDDGLLTVDYGRLAEAL